MDLTYYAATHRATTLAHSMASLTIINPTNLVTTFPQDCTLPDSTLKSTSGRNKMTLQTTFHRRVSICKMGAPMMRTRARTLPTTAHQIKMHPLAMGLSEGRGPPSLGPNDARITSQNPTLPTPVCSVRLLSTRPKTQCSHSGQRLLLSAPTSCSRTNN